MELDRYLGKKVAITLTNNFFYKGDVVDCDNDSIVVLDVTGKTITLKPEVIISIREVGNG